MKTIHHSLTSLSYAEALLELATEQNQAEAIGKELDDLREVLTKNPTFAQFLADPGIGHEERAGVLQRVFGNQVSKLLRDFLGVLNAKGRLGLLKEIADAYEDLLSKQLGKIEVDVTVAHRLEPAQLEEVRQAVSKALKKDAVVHQYVDDSIIGGLVLKFEDRLIDASVKHQLQAMREQLLSHRPS